MSPPFSLSDPDHSEEIDREIAHLLKSGMLGRSPLLKALFAYLVDRGRRNQPPREVEIAQDVFARSADIAVEDGISRVYVHRLRRRLESFYRDNPSYLQIELPHGEYRLVARLIIPQHDGPIPDEHYEPDLPEKLPGPGRRRYSFLIWGTFMAAFCGFAILVLTLPKKESSVLESNVWSPILTNGRPTLVVEGDYYLFGEYDGTLDVRRLILDFNIRTRDELEAYLLRHPDDARKYGDVHEKYLPFSISYALMQLSPILRDMKDLRIAPASALSTGPLPIQNIIYLGLTSGLAEVSTPLLASSRFTFGSGYDEIVDQVLHKSYLGHSDMLDNGEPERQYGIVSEFPGPNGNRYLVVTGTGELALSGLAQAITDQKLLAQIDRTASAGLAFEALFKIDGQQGAVTSISLITVARRDSSRIWSADHPTRALQRAR